MAYLYNEFDVSFLLIFYHLKSIIIVKRKILSGYTEGVMFRRKTKNNLPNFIILFSLLCVKFFLNNPLFLEKFALIKENRMIKLGRLFFVLRLTSLLFQYSFRVFT